MKYFLVFCLLLLPSLNRAQDTLHCILPNEYNEVFGAKLKGQVYTGMAGLIGDEFFNENYVKGDVFLENGEVANNQLLRYNGRVDGVLLFPEPSMGGTEILLDKYFVKGFCLKNINGNSNICFTKIKIANEFSSDSSQVYGQVLYRNKLSLYSYRRYAFIEEVQGYSGNEQIAFKKYGPSFIYYFQLPNGNTIGFKKFKKRNLYALFPGKKKTLRKLFRDNHMRRFRDEQDLVKVSEILNSMYN